jgi:ADP-heptose:LPS heptosyltransferase
MQSKIKLSSSSHGLGDILLLTSVAKHLLAANKKAVVSLPVKVQRFAILFDGLADIIIEENDQYLKDIGGGHYATRKLRNFFEHAELLDNRPLVLHSDPDSEAWASNYLADKKRPFIFVPHCAKQWHDVRSLNPQNYEGFIQQLKDDGCTPIICQNSSNPVSTNEKNVLTDLDLSKYICLLRKVGNYLGCNTGDMHLAIAVGATCFVLQPKGHPLFNESEWNYQHPAIIYHHL